MQHHLLDRVVVDRVMLGLRGCEMEWLFDKGRLYGRAGAPQHLAFIVSAAFITRWASLSPQPRRRATSWQTMAERMARLAP